MPIERINDLNNRGGELFKGIVFRKYCLRMNIDIDLQIKESDQPRKHNC